MTPTDLTDLRTARESAQSHDLKAAAALVAALRGVVGDDPTYERFVQWFADAPTTDDTQRAEIVAALGLPADPRGPFGDKPRGTAIRVIAESLLSAAPRNAIGVVESRWGSFPVERAMTDAILATLEG